MYPSSVLTDLPELIQRTLPLNLSAKSPKDSDSGFPEGGSSFHIQPLRLLFLISLFADPFHTQASISIVSTMSYSKLLTNFYFFPLLIVPPAAATVVTPALPAVSQLPGPMTVGPVPQSLPLPVKVKTATNSPDEPAPSATVPSVTELRRKIRLALLAQRSLPVPAHPPIALSADGQYPPPPAPPKIESEEERELRRLRDRVDLLSQSEQSKQVSIDELQLRVAALQSENTALAVQNSTLRDSLGTLRTEVERLQIGLEGPTGMVNRATAIADTISRKLYFIHYTCISILY